MNVDRERLLHDVGKYIARTALNLPEGAVVPTPLAALLLRDVYGRGDEPRMSVVFEQQVGGARDAQLEACRAELVALDSLEERARAGDAEALTEVAAGARRVAALLRAWARGEPR